MMLSDGLDTDSDCLRLVDYFPRTFLSLGFAAFAFALAFLLDAARIAPAASFDTPSCLAIFACTALKPGCALAMIIPLGSLIKDAHYFL